MPEYKDTATGFEWGPVTVNRVHSSKGLALSVQTHDAKGETLRSVQIVSSPKGNSLRVFIDGAEAFTTAVERPVEPEPEAPKAKKPKKSKKKAEPGPEDCQMGFDQLADGWLRPSCSLHGELGEEYDNYEEAVEAFESHAASVQKKEQGS